MVMAQPVRGSAAPRGVVLAVAGLSPLWTMTREIAQGGIMEVYVVDARGHVVAHSDPGRVRDGLDASQVDIVRKFIDSKGRTSSTLPFVAADANGREVRMLGTFTRVPDTGLGVIVQVEQDKAFYSAIRMRNRSLGLAALVALLALLLGTAYAGYISRPIHALAHGAQRLAGGAYDTRVKVSARNEVGVLADAFDRRKLMIGAQLAMLASSLILALTSQLGLASIWVIYLVTALSAAANTLGMPARQALIPSLVPREHLAGALSLNITAWQLATVVGPSRTCGVARSTAASRRTTTPRCSSSSRPPRASPRSSRERAERGCAAPHVLRRPRASPRRSAYS